MMVSENDQRRNQQEQISLYLCENLHENICFSLKMCVVECQILG